MAQWVHRRGLLSMPACSGLVQKIHQADTDSLELDRDNFPLLPMVERWVEASAMLLDVQIFRRMSDVRLHLVRYDGYAWRGPVSECWPDQGHIGVKVCGIVRLQGSQTHELFGMASPTLSLGDAVAWPAYLPYIVQPCPNRQERTVLQVRAYGEEWR